MHGARHGGDPERVRRRRRAPRPRRAAVAGALALGLVAAALSGCKPGPTEGPGDGKGLATAGTSCWGIKQAYPASASGTYWLVTPSMDRPAPFYCDMVTDGGGWVLVGRGREGWTFLPTGQGSPAQVRSTVSGPGAFAPAALPSAVVDDLLDGAPLAALSQGIRIERMTNTAGTAHQDLRIFPTQGHWNWTFDAGQLLSKVVIDGTTYRGSNTYDTYASVAGQTTNQLAGVQGTRRMFTWPWDRNDHQQGFSFGHGAPAGSTSGSSNLWQKPGAYTIPFTRVWVRPKLGNATRAPQIPVGGYPADPKPDALADRSELAPWGVVGLDHEGEATVEPWNTPVLAVEAVGSRVFVGGRFTGVRPGPSGAIADQASLAAFDLDGNWISSFRPDVAGRVWDLDVTAGGKLVVAGDFTSIDGVPTTRGLALLDPATGAVETGFRASVSRVEASEWRVRTVDVHDSWIYAAGLFDRAAGAGGATATVANASSFSATTGALGSWRPTPNGSVIDVAATADGTRVLMAGLFGTVGGSTIHRSFAITDRSTGAPTAGTGTWQPSTTEHATFQQAVADLGDRLAVGGSEHVTQLWDRTRSQLLDATITKPGGDTQVIEVVGDRAYVGCHCGGWAYLGANSFEAPRGFRAIEPINLVGAWDTATWTYDTSWYPGSLKGDAGEGVWAIDADQRGCLWVGGDLSRGAYSGDPATDWLGGFARFCPLDRTVPTAPANVSVTSAGTARTVRWTAASDPDGSAPTYEVVRDGTVVATVNAATRSWTDPDGPAGARYAVRATDARGNRSASAPPIVVG